MGVKIFSSRLQMQDRKPGAKIYFCSLKVFNIQFKRNYFQISIHVGKFISTYSCTEYARFLTLVTKDEERFQYLLW